MEPTVELQTRTKSRLTLPAIIGGGLLLLVLISVFTFYFSTAPPSTFSAKSIEITPGQSAADIAQLLESEDIVRSSTILYAILILKYDPSQLRAGRYEFDAPQSVFDVAHHLAISVPLESQVVVTFPEGFTQYDFYNLLPATLSSTSSLDVAQYEGYLFPDTYFIPVSFTTEDVIALMQSTFTEKLASYEEAIALSNFTMEEVIILASIIEREANDEMSMKLVSGILQNRLDIGMPLQVDASVAYGLAKSGTELTREDIDTDGPFNTYTRAGLPPAPIANPGLMAIEAVLEPTASAYLYYITGNDGNFYYARTLKEHNQNIIRYLQ